MSNWRKMTVGPARSVACGNCGGSVSVSWSAMLGLVPFLLAIVAGPYTGAFAISAALFVVGALAMVLVHLYWVSIVPR